MSGGSKPPVSRPQKLHVVNTVPVKNSMKLSKKNLMCASNNLSIDSLSHITALEKRFDYNLNEHVMLCA
jgi:hypothetical protein